MKIVWILLTFIAGSFLPLQGGLNTKLGKSIGSAVHASLISFVIGALTLFIYIIVSRQSFSMASLKSAPPYVFIGGVLGAFYVTAIIFVFPKIGAALTFALIVAGQMVMAVVLDHFNILVAEQHRINFPKILGITLLIAGVIIIRKY